MENHIRRTSSTDTETPHTLAQPFRLFDRPQEVQDNIYQQYCALETWYNIYQQSYGPYHVTIRRNSDHSHTLSGIPNTISLQLTCQKMRVDSEDAKRKSYLGVLTISSSRGVSPSGIHHFLASSGQQWLMQATKGLYLYSPTISMNRWSRLLEMFPSVKHLQVDYRIDENIDEDLGPLYGEDGQLRKAVNAVKNGSRDRDLIEDERRFSLRGLARWCNETARACTIHFDVNLDFIYDDYSRTSTYVKFDIASKAEKVISRTGKKPPFEHSLRFEEFVRFTNNS